MTSRRREAPENKESSCKEEDAEEEDFEETEREASVSFMASRRKAAPLRQQVYTSVPEPVDDFLVNFLRRAGLRRTLGRFKAEWCGSAPKFHTETSKSAITGAASGVVFILDARSQRQVILSELEAVRKEILELREQILVAGQHLFRTRRESDFHRLQHRRTAEDKNGLLEALKDLRAHMTWYKPALRQLEDKYRDTVTQKMLLSLQKERAQSSSNRRASQQEVQPKERKSIQSPDSFSQTGAESEFPVYSSREVKPPSAQVDSPTKDSPSTFSLACSIRGHRLPITCVDLSPGRPVLASASDDHTWRLWALPGSREKVGQLMVTGKGHSDWLTCCTFHPDGTKLATTSGDTTVRLWDLSQGLCVLTLSGHSHPTWGCSFHSCCLFLASCSTDRTAKVWDLSRGRCRFTLRRHTAAVNSVSFLSSSNLLLTCSADKTLALWDARLGVCTTTCHGHQHPCSHAAFSPAADVLASCDSSGVVKLWDWRKPELPLTSVDAGPPSCNHLAFSPSGQVLAVASSDGLVRLVEMNSWAVSRLSGHSHSVQSVTFDHKGATLVSAGSDGMIQIWVDQTY